MYMEKGLHGLSKPEETLDVGNSGTIQPALSPVILAGQDFDTVLSGDASLNSLPYGKNHETSLHDGS